MKKSSLLLTAILLIQGLILTTGCTSLQRSPGSGYTKEMETGPRIVTVKKTLYTEDIHESLRDLERSLNTRREMEQYSKVVPYLKDEEERIEFLSVPTLEGRQTWINQKNIWARAKTDQALLKKISESQDIAIGMITDNVRQAWGEPASIEVSGNPYYKNERWKYQRYAPSTEGFRKETRLVYFEGGRVVGWETE